MTDNSPWIIGLSGEAATGKTITADGLAPPAQTLEENSKVYYDHFFLARPLYRLATARQKMEGERRLDRIRYETYDVLFNLLGPSPLFGSLPMFDDFIGLVHYISTGIQCEPAGIKARTFMQKVGSLLRSFDEDVFVKAVKKEIDSAYNIFKKDYPDRIWAGIISDVRYPNECKYINDYPNGILIELTASDEVRRQRLIERDGAMLTQEQAHHESETSISQIPAEWYTYTLDNSDISKQEQILAVKEFLETYICG